MRNLFARRPVLPAGLLALLALLALGACSTAQQAQVTAGVGTACASVAAVQNLLPWVEGFAGLVPSGATDVALADAAVGGLCMSAPAVEALVAKLDADIALAKAMPAAATIAPAT